MYTRCYCKAAGVSSWTVGMETMACQLFIMDTHSPLRYLLRLEVHMNNPSTAFPCFLLPCLFAWTWQKFLQLIHNAQRDCTAIWGIYFDNSCPDINSVSLVNQTNVIFLNTHQLTLFHQLVTLEGHINIIYFMWSEMEESEPSNTCVLFDVVSKGFYSRSH